MNTDELRKRLKDYENQVGNAPLYQFFLEALLPGYEPKVVRWVWANDRVYDFRPLWIPRESTAPEAAGVLTLPPLDKSYKWNYGLDERDRVIVARQENDNDSDLSLFVHHDDRIDGVHYCAYDSNSTDYMMVSECCKSDGKIVSHVIVSDHEVDSEEYEHDTAGRVVRITRERNFLTPEMESERAKKLRADLEGLQQRRFDLGMSGAGVRNVAPAKSDVIVLDYTAAYDSKGQLTRIDLHADGNDRTVFQKN